MTTQTTPSSLLSFRARYDLTQKDLAEKLHVNANTISSYETSARPIPHWFSMAVNRLGAELERKLK